MVNDRTDAVVYPYTRRQVPALEESFRTFVPDELQQIERSIKSLADAVPQVADADPDKPRKGMVRYAISPWNPLGNGQEGLVVYNGTAWKSYAKVEGDTFTGAVTGTDLYLSGGVYLGGTGSANKLEDYEEGTWTPVFNSVSAPTYSTQNGKYTKIGNVVNCTVEIVVGSGLDTSDSSGVTIGGLPFTAVANEETALASLGRYTSLLSSKASSVSAFRLTSSAVLLLEGNNDNVQYSNCASSGVLQMAFTYRTT